MTDPVKTQQQTEVAVLAGGCFWGVEDILRGVPGVIDTDVGYTGGWLKNPTYEDTHESRSGLDVVQRRGLSPGLLAQAPRRIHLSLSARVICSTRKRPTEPIPKSNRFARGTR